MPADERPGPLWFGDHPLHELSMLLHQQFFRSPSGATAVGCFSPRPTCPTPANFARALVATHGEQGWIMRVRNWMNKDAECCSSMHACITLRRFCTAHDTRTRHNACESTSVARMLAHCTAARACTRVSTHTYTHVHVICGHTSLQHIHSAHFALW